MRGDYYEKTASFVESMKLDKAVFVDRHFLDKIGDEYVEVAPGVFDRRINSIKDLTTKEQICKKHLKNVDFTNNIVVIVYHIKGADFIAHYHNFKEKIISVSGGFIHNLEGKKVKPGNFVIVPPWTVHVYIPLDEGYSIIVIPK